jgi:hypothetical protein
VPFPPVVPPVSPPPTTVPSVAPDRFEPNDTPALATQLGLVGGTTTLAGLSLTTRSDLDAFAFVSSRAGVYQVSAPGTMVRIVDASGRQVALGANQVAIRVLRPRTTLFVEISAPGASPVASYSLRIAAQSPRVVPTHVAHSPRPHGPVIHRLRAGRNRPHH